MRDPKWVLLFTLLAGCSATEHRLPEAFRVVPQTWRGQEGLSGQVHLSGPGEVRRWWHVFSDEELSRLIDTAFEANPSVREALWSIERVRAEKRAELSRAYPRVQLSSSARCQVQDGEAGSSFGAGVEVSWEFDTLIKLPERLRAQRAEVEGAEEEIHEVRVLLAAEVAQSYFDFLASAKKLELLQTLLEKSEERAEVLGLLHLKGLRDRSQLEKS